MSNLKDDLAEIMGSLKQERDELRLKMHLAEMEAKDEYDRLSGKFDELSDQYDPVRDAVEETADNVFAALKLAAEEMKNGFLRVRKAVKEE